MATGILVLGIEKATRLLTFVVGADKDYAATIRLGMSTTTDDAEGEVLTAADASGVTLAAVEAVVATLRGSILQAPSTVSAIKVDGKRAYARVREGERFELPERPVTVHAFDVVALRDSSAVAGGPTPLPVVDLDVTITCSSGTYVRALARDLGAALGVGGHLTALRRTRVGGYGLEVARTLEALETGFSVVPLADAARAILPARELTEDEVRELSYGKRIDRESSGPEGTVDAPVAAFAPDGTLVALLAGENGRSRPVLVFAPA